MAAVAITAPGPVPPPARRLVELLDVGDQTDETGRLLLEDSAPEAAQRRARQAGIAMRSESCPFRDTPSRLGGRMNVSAYEALRSDVAGVLDGFAWLARERQGAEPPPAGGTAGRLYEASYLGLTLPIVLVHRAVRPFAPHGELPTVVASLFKASRGLFSVAVGLRNDPAPPAHPDAEGVVVYADGHHHLARRETRRVCAAPTRLIERTIAVILTGDGADASKSRLPEWIPFSQLWRVYRVQDELSEALSTYRFVWDRLARSAPHRRAGRPEELFGLLVPGSVGTFGQLTEAVVAHAASAERQLNGLLGRSEETVAFSLDDLLALL